MIFRLAKPLCLKLEVDIFYFMLMKQNANKKGSPITPVAVYSTAYICKAGKAL